MAVTKNTSDLPEQVFPPMNPLEQLTYERELEQKQLRDETKRSTQAAHIQNKAAILRKKASDISKQENCPHMKPMNAGSAIAGQRDHQQVYHWICQYCAKEWTGAELPPHLRIDLILVGGPNY